MDNCFHDFDDVFALVMFIKGVQRFGIDHDFHGMLPTNIAVNRGTRDSISQKMLI